MFYLGLAAALAIYAFAFVPKLDSFAQNVVIESETNLLSSMLALIEAAQLKPHRDGNNFELRKLC